jgi:ornithine cyclodeaminase/alanine dehydrogenase-like protein (mu-crystallin family)
MRFVSGVELRELVPMSDAIAAVKEGFAASSAGQTDQPGRIGLADGSALMMLANGPRSESVVAKVITIRPTNRKLDLPNLHAIALLFDGDTGQPLYVLDGGSLTALRTGAASGAATDLMASSDAAVLAIIGAGQQALDQIRGVSCVRPIREVRIFSRQRSSAQLLADRVEAESPGLSVSVCGSSELATGPADVICCATNSLTPVISVQAVRSNAHVNAIGSYRRGMCELPLDLLLHATLIAVDQIEAALAEAGEIIKAIEGGHLSRDQLVEIGQLSGGPRDIGGVTIFKSVGIAIQDWAVADLVRGLLAPEATLLTSQAG